MARDLVDGAGKRSRRFHAEGVRGGGGARCADRRGPVRSAEPLGYDPRAGAFALLDEAKDAAAAEDKLVLIVSGGDWCIWCHYLAAFLDRHGEIDAALHEVFVVAKVYVGDENRNTEFFARLPEAVGAPHFWVLSSTGEVLASQNTLPLEDGDKSYDAEAFMAFIDRWKRYAN